MSWGKTKSGYHELVTTPPEDPAAAARSIFAREMVKEGQELARAGKKTADTLTTTQNRYAKAPHAAAVVKSCGDGILVIKNLVLDPTRVLQSPFVARSLPAALAALARTAAAEPPSEEQLRQSVRKLQDLYEAAEGVADFLAPMNSLALSFAEGCEVRCGFLKQQGAAVGEAHFSIQDVTGAVPPSAAASLAALRATAAAATATPASAAAGGSSSYDTAAGGPSASTAAAAGFSAASIATPEDAWSPPPPSQLASYHLGHIASKLYTYHEIGCDEASCVIARLEEWYPNRQLNLEQRLWLSFCWGEDRWVVVRDIMGIIGERRLQELRKAQPGNFALLLQGAQFPVSPALQSYRDAGARTVSVARNLASSFNFFTDTFASRGLSEVQAASFVKPFTNEVRKRLYTMFLLADLRGQLSELAGIKEGMEAAVRLNYSTMFSVKATRDYTGVLLTASAECQQAILEEMREMFMNLQRQLPLAAGGVAGEPAPLGQPAAAPPAAVPVQQAQQGSSAANATAAAEAEQAAAAEEEAASHARQQQPAGAEPASTAKPNAAAADGTAPPVQAEQRPSATKGWVKFGEEEQLEAAAEDSAAGPDEPAAVAVAAAQAGATGPGEPAAVPAAATTPAGFKSWGANPLYCSGGGANSAPAAPFGVKSLDAAAADKEQRPTN